MFLACYFDGGETFVEEFSPHTDTLGLIYTTVNGAFLAASQLDIVAERGSYRFVFSEDKETAKRLLSAYLVVTRENLLLKADNVKRAVEGVLRAEVMA